jgi:hypothetical protein
MSVGGLLSAVFSPGSLACSHCGSAELYPYPGPFGSLGGVLGRVRYACRACRRHSWLSHDAEVPGRPAEDVRLEASPRPYATTSLDALDLDVQATPPESPRADLRALDDALALGRRRRGPKKR